MEISASSARIADATQTVLRAEKDAREKVELAQRQVKEAQFEAEQQIEGLRDQTRIQSASENERRAQLIEQEKNKTYSALRAIQKNAQQELDQTRATSEKKISDLNNHYRNSMNSIEHDGSIRLKELQTQHSNQIENQEKAAKNEYTLMQSNQIGRMTAIHEQHEDRIKQEEQSRTQGFQALKGQSEIANQQAEEKFTANHKKLTEGFHSAITRLNQSASQKLKSLKTDTTQKLAAYETRQKDPFYRMVSLSPELQETDEAFIIRVKIPAHEEKKVQLNVSDTALTLSGSRRNQEKLTSEEGETLSTASFQSFSHAIPIRWPIDPSGVNRAYIDGTVIFTVPKKSASHKAADPKLEVARTVVERPRFPENLPLSPPPVDELNNDAHHTLT